MRGALLGIAFTSWPKLGDQFFTRQSEVGGHFSQNGRQNAKPQRIVTWNSHLMFTPLLRGQSHVATSLSHDTVAPFFHGLRQIGARYIAG
jgi:hypothetical protein